MLSAKVDHENDGEYVDVRLRDEAGNLLCDGRGPLMTAQQTPAVCDGASTNAYVYVGQQPKRGVTAPMCRESGEPIALPRLATASKWAADFVLWVDRSGDDFARVRHCGSVNAD
ncbi:hypothetical protein [Nocardioides nematodiphilus]|uniref:hypothetical protein n=1 Tax=Nocardioides nematodiphilus TaxID=2849669 RepID=UPI001CD96D8E|nr:hypothetical protein [Nocardioides nematodiphilus]MCA1984735.1 hypothetical protein [Nocardioides nematodiphilus]